jgi:hypothetical protein
MVYCPKCGELNEEDTRFYKSCGASLRRRSYGRFSDEREMCFGVPMSGNILGLFFGVMIILWGVTELLRLNINLWALALIGFGVILILNIMKRRPDFR